jgi:lysophospholipase L1-like esterase
MKTLFVVGDSISMHYGPFLSSLLPAGWRLCRKADDNNATRNNLDIPAGENNGDSRMVLNYLRCLYDTGWNAPDLLVINCGLHDIKSCNGVLQVPLPAYEKNMRDIFALLLEQNIPVYWISSTPVDDELHNSRQPEFRRYNADLLAYNLSAACIAREKGIPVIDLYQATLPVLPEGLLDHVHYTGDVRKMQAAFIFDHLRERMQFLFQGNQAAITKS